MQKKKKKTKFATTCSKRYEPIHASKLQLTIHTLQRAETEKKKRCKKNSLDTACISKKGKVSNSIVRTLFQRFIHDLTI